MDAGKVDLQLSQINALAELERSGWPFEPVGEDEVKTKCPLHEDTSPSCSLNIRKNVFICHVASCPGSKGGDLITFLAAMLKTTRRVILEDLATRYSLGSVKIIESHVVEKYHAAIWEAKTFLAELRKRAVSDAAIRFRRLGFDGQRITIPIYNESGLCVNIRRYLPGAPSKDKMKNIRGHGGERLYPLDQLKYDTIVICGGEVKAIVVADYMNAYNIGAITSTAGEGKWKQEFSRALRGKRVYVCLDIDKAGRDGAASIAAQVRADARWVGVIDLPLDKDKYPKGDVNDYFGPENHTALNFLQLMQQTPAWTIPDLAAPVEETEATRVTLKQALKADYTNKLIEVPAVVTMLDTSPYVIPREVRVTCDRTQDLCIVCPVYAVPETPDSVGVQLTLNPLSPSILEMVGCARKAQREALREGLRIPPCKVAKFTPLSYYNIEDVRISPQLEISTQSVDHITQQALCVGHGLECNESYLFTGKMLPHPHSQQSVLLISKTTPMRDALSSYDPSEEALAELHAFQPIEWTLEALHDKLTEIYNDLSANVTRIFRRQDLHLVVDLAYHSALLVPFDGRIEKGWVEVLIAGDSAQGKSEVTQRIIQHYSLGERVDCKNATVPGLLGGLQQIGNRWFVTWGVIPTHDRRLVVLEELKGASIEVISKLTDMRSSGIAEIPKIDRKRAYARTRLIAISNPRSDCPLSSYNFGIEMIKELIGGLEDIRRFDMALLVSSSQISAAELNMLQRHRPNVKHTYNADLCRRLVLWAWTRKPDEVVFTENATQAVLDSSSKLCEIFTDNIPLVDRGSMRFKLARLATALACRTFSCGKSRRVVVVRECHVKYIALLLERLYSDDVFGYKDFSDAIKLTQTLIDPDEVRKAVLETPYPRDFIDQLIASNEVELRDICDWCAWDKEDGLRLLSFLVRKHALLRAGRGYRKSAAFIGLLKELRGSELLDRVDRPGFISDRF